MSASQVAPTETIKDDVPTLRFLLAAIAFLGTLMLGMGQMDYRLPIVTAVAAALGLYVTDKKKWFRLSGMVANIAAIIAVAISVRDYYEFDAESQLLAIANLLVYLQLIMFFQEKTIRIFWQLLTLSLLQVVVAAALNLSVMFAVLILVYVFLAIAVLMHLHMYRLRIAHGLAGPTSSTSLGERRGRAVWFGATRDFIGRRVRKMIAIHVVFVGLASLALTIVIFFSIPRRPDQGVWTRFAPTTIHTVGYSGSVDFVSFGPIQQDPEVVMRVEFLQEDRDEPYYLSSEPLFRGRVLTYYDGEGWRFRKKAEGKPPIPIG